MMGDNYDEAHSMGESFVRENKMIYIDPYDKDPMVYAGQGTVGMEIMKQNPDIDTILVPIGGGGLITGVSIGARIMNPNVRIIGVQTEACPAMKAAINENIFYGEYPNDESICEALIGGIGELAFRLRHECIDEVVTVKEKTIQAAVKFLALKEKTIVEPSGAVCVAAIVENQKIIGDNVACVLSGGNIDENLFTEIISN